MSFKEQTPPLPEKRYVVHSMFTTFQGEGLHFGRRAVFVRFSGCNVWNGHEEDRARDAISNSLCAGICDTTFLGVDARNGGGRFTAGQLAQAAHSLWGEKAAGYGEPMVVLTGGEPGLQISPALVAELRGVGFYVAVETNGTCVIPSNVHWVAIAPKFPLPIAPRDYDELKLLSCFLTYANAAMDISARFRWVQPVDTRPKLIPLGTSASHSAVQAAVERANAAEIQKCIDFCHKHPEYRLGLQAHKVWHVE